MEICHGGQRNNWCKNIALGTFVGIGFLLVNFETEQTGPDPVEGLYGIGLAFLISACLHTLAMYQGSHSTALCIKDIGFMVPLALALVCFQPLLSTIPLCDLVAGIFLCFLQHQLLGRTFGTEHERLVITILSLCLLHLSPTSISLSWQSGMRVFVASTMFVYNYHQQSLTTATNVTNNLLFILMFLCGVGIEWTTSHTTSRGTLDYLHIILLGTYHVAQQYVIRDYGAMPCLLLIAVQRGVFLCMQSHTAPLAVALIVLAANITTHHRPSLATKNSHLVLCLVVGIATAVYQVVERGQI